jgi:hypothetical protein
LLGLVVGIGQSAGQVVVEDLHSVGKIDAVPAPVVLALGLVPLELDVHADECMHNSPTFPAADQRQ